MTHAHHPVNRAEAKDADAEDWRRCSEAQRQIVEEMRDTIRRYEALLARNV